MTLTATCRCGATKIALPHPPIEAKQCNCTYCYKTGAIWSYYQPGEVTLLSEEADQVYSASGGINRHHFCGTCGISSWGDSPDWASVFNNDGTPKNGDPNSFPETRIAAVNIRLIDDFDIASVRIEQVDGRNSW